MHMKCDTHLYTRGHSDILVTLYCYKSGTENKNMWQITANIEEGVLWISLVAEGEGKDGS
jgi:hypothetical protein